MNAQKVICTAIIVALAAGILVHPVLAARGTPGSTEFGAGITIHLDGDHLEEAIRTIRQLPLDWIAVPFNWASWYPAPDSQPDFSMLDQVMDAACSNGSAVMLRLTNAPDWARNGTGPDAGQVAALLLNLQTRYPEAFQAVEIFPGANLRATWYGDPDPVAYAALFQTVKDQLSANSSGLLLIAGGLTPAAPDSGDMNDLEFLKGLYAAGLRDAMPVISIQYTELTGDSLTAPNGIEHRILRHYEEVRQVMRENRHENGMLWITQIVVPSGTINEQDNLYQTPQGQADWLTQAALQIRSQLYMGVSFFQNVNPNSSNSETAGSSSLLMGNNTFHPFYQVLRSFSAQSGLGTTEKSTYPKGNLLKRSI